MAHGTTLMTSITAHARKVVGSRQQAKAWYLIVQNLPTTITSAETPLFKVIISTGFVLEGAGGGSGGVLDLEPTLLIILACL